MIYHTESRFQIAFGDARTQFIPQVFKNIQKKSSIFSCFPFDQLKKIMKLKQLIFLHQVHGAEGLIINSLEQISNTPSFSKDGDYLMTTVPSIGLAIATADCLPIIIYSSLCQVVSIIHAGWRGSVNQIALNAVKCMQEQYAINPSELKIFFGPSAKQCCYQVNNEVIEALNKFSFRDEVFRKRGNNIFFNLPRFNQLQLQEIGVSENSFNQAYNDCTICDRRFCSYRREQNSYRQVTVVALK